MNLLSLINPSFSTYFTVAISANHALIRLKNPSRKLSVPYIFIFAITVAIGGCTYFICGFREFL
jgi:hypothetical protein